MRKKEATSFILIPTILVLTTLSAFYLVQGKMFQDQLAVQRYQNERLLVDCAQVLASRDYQKEHKVRGSFRRLQYEIDVDEKMVLVHGSNDLYRRPLMGETPK